MKRISLLASSILFVLLATVCCAKDGWKMSPEKPAQPDWEENKHIEELASFVKEAALSGDCIASISGNDTEFSVKTFLGNEISVPVKIEIVPEDGKTDGKTNYVIDGRIFAEFHLGSTTQNVPSDIHQYYNPALAGKSANALKILVVGGDFADDATALLPSFLSGSGSTSIDLCCMSKAGTALSDIDVKAAYSRKNAFSCAAGWTDAGTPKLGDVLAEQPWDVVALMDDPMKASKSEFDEKEIAAVNAVFDNICKACTKKRPSVVFVLPPSLPGDNKFVLDNFGGVRADMDNALAAYGKKLTENTRIFEPVSVGAAIRDAVGCWLFLGNDLSCDGTHLDKGAGQYIAAATVFARIIEVCTELKLEENSFKAVAASSDSGAKATKVDASNLNACFSAARAAVAHPFEYFELDIPPTNPEMPLPDVGYEDSGIVLQEEEQEEEKPQSKVLTFDFSTYKSGLMPQSALGPEEINLYNPYYSFKLTDSGSGKSYKFYNAAGCYHYPSSPYTGLYDGKGTGYLGLPALDGYKLTGIQADRGSATLATVKLEILSDVAARTVVSGGSSITWNAGVKNPTKITLTGTKENTVYYIHSTDNTYVGIASLKLTYELAGAADAHPTDYDVFLLLGQSNMAGRGMTNEVVAAADCTPIENVYIFTDEDNTVVYAAQPRFNVESSVRKGIKMQKCNLAAAFAKKVAKTTGHKVLIVLNARGETLIESWRKVNPNDYAITSDNTDKAYGKNLHLYDEAIRRGKAAMKYGTLKGILWHQGEGNSNIGMVPYYMSKVVTLASDLRGDLGVKAENVPFIVGEINYATGVSAENINPVLNTVSSNVPNSACASAEGCGANADNVHFNTAGLNIIGERYADEYLRLAGYTK